MSDAYHLRLKSKNFVIEDLLDYLEEKGFAYEEQWGYSDKYGINLKMDYREAKKQFCLKGGVLVFTGLISELSISYDPKLGLISLSTELTDLKKQGTKQFLQKVVLIAKKCDPFVVIEESFGYNNPYKFAT